MPTPTSIRLTDDELALVAVHAQRLQKRTGRTHTTTDVIRYLLRAAAPPDAKAAPGDSAFRQAYTTVFGKDTP